jgi:hypothetical protein
VHDFEDAVLNGYLDPLGSRPAGREALLTAIQPGWATTSPATSSRTPCTASPGCRSG